MTESQRKWLMYLQLKGVLFTSHNHDGSLGWWNDDKQFTFQLFPHQYRVPAQPIPDIPDWRELCRDMQSKGVKFEKQCDEWVLDECNFVLLRREYRIPQQPIPEWKEEMTEETKPDQKEETPHLEQQIQWHEDWLHHLRTGEPMREYEFRSVNGDGDAASEWKLLSNRHPSWAKTHEYRRKPRTVTYWHCAVMFDGLKSEVITGYCKDEVSDQNKRCKEAYPDAKFSPITETTVEMED